MHSLIGLAILSFVLSLIVTPLVRHFCQRWNIVDYPDFNYGSAPDRPHGLRARARKIHKNAIPRAGGVAVVVSYLLACGILMLTPAKGGDIIWSSHDQIVRLIPALALVFLVGLGDDVRGFTATPKLIGELAAAVIAWFGGVHLSSIAGHPLPDWLSFLATVFWLLACTNALNLIDGLDGLACGVGIFATATTLLAAIFQHNYMLLMAVVPLLGALLGFLRYNYNPATIFLGDSGSLFIGFLLGCFGVFWSQKSATIAGMTAPLMAFALPLLDTSIAIMRRFLRHKPIFSADRGHIHHRLLDRGMKPASVVKLLYVCCAAGALCAMAVMNAQTDLAAIVIFAVLIVFGVNSLDYIEFRIAGRLLNPTGFRHAFAARMHLESLNEDLKTATTEEECWDAIRQACLELGFSHVSMRLDGGIRDERFSVVSGPDETWSVRVPLSPKSFVNIGHNFQNPASASIMAPFAQVIRRNLEPKLAQLQEDVPEKTKVRVATYRNS